MRYAITPKQWQPVIDALAQKGHVKVDDLTTADFLIYNGRADDFPQLPPSVRWVQLGLAGIDAFFDASLITKDRIWSNCAGVYARPVAESAVALLLSVLHLHTTNARAREWDTTGAVDKATRWLYDTNVAIIGAGGIARDMVPMLHGFGCTVTCVNRRGRAVEGADTTVAADQTENVLAKADHVVLAAPLTDKTRHMINDTTLALMKSSAVLINVGRGPLVDTDALVRALKNGTIASAGLDVTDPEPLPSDHPLWGMDNVLITPHVANTAANIPYLIRPAVLANLAAFEAGKPLPTQVDPEQGY